MLYQHCSARLSSGELIEGIAADNIDGTDKGNMRKCPVKITQKSLGARFAFLRQQSYIISNFAASG